MQITINNSTLIIDRLPDKCPLCQHSISPKITNSFQYISDDNLRNELQFVLGCPNFICRNFFIGYYNFTEVPENGLSRFYKLIKTAPFNIKDIDIVPEIKEMYAKFYEIYNQAYKAEQYALNEISGVGYRKALEYLVKDYCISKKPADEEIIKKKLLGNVIKDDISDSRIKDCAMRAAWLGNDEVHYLKKWGDKDIEDLKILISLTINYIHSDMLSEKYLQDMPE